MLLEDDSLDLISHVQFDKNSTLSFALLNNEIIVFWDLKRGLEVTRISKNKKMCHLTYNSSSNRIYFSNIDDIQELKIRKYEEFAFKEINQSFISNKFLLAKQKKIITFNSKNIYVWVKSKNYKKDYDLYFSFEETKLQKINDICLAPSENLIAITDSQIINFYKISDDFKQFTFANNFSDLKHKFNLNFRNLLFSKTSLFFFVQPQKHVLWMFHELEFYFQHDIYSLNKPSKIIEKDSELKIKQYFLLEDEKILILLYENNKQAENILEFMKFEEETKNFVTFKTIKGNFVLMEMSINGDKLITSDRDHSITIWNFGSEILL